MLESAQTEAKVRAQRAAQQTADEARSELGEWAFEILEAYFPEEARQRRRQERVTVLVAGFLLGVVVGVALGRAGE